MSRSLPTPSPSASDFRLNVYYNMIKIQNTNILTNSSDWKLLRIYCFTVILEISLTTGVPGMSLNIISKFGNKPGNTPLLMVTFTVASLNCPLIFYWFSVFCFNCCNFTPDCPQKTGPRNFWNSIFHWNLVQVAKQDHFLF